jgi:hypothetical protein
MDLNENLLEAAELAWDEVRNIDEGRKDHHDGFTAVSILLRLAGMPDAVRNETMDLASRLGTTLSNAWELVSN